MAHRRAALTDAPCFAGGNPDSQTPSSQKVMRYIHTAVIFLALKKIAGK